MRDSAGQRALKLVVFSSLVIVSFGFVPRRPIRSKSSWTELHASVLDVLPKSAVSQNMFHDDRKPVVLLGASGPDKELPRLAQSLLHDSARNDDVVKVISVHKAVNKKDLVKRIQEESLQWPNIIVIDYALVGRDESLKTHMEDIAKTLYDIGLLSIYINVHVDQFEKDNDTLELKQTYEDNVFVKYSDYEICIRDEGSDEDAWSHIQWELDRTLARARLIAPIPGDKTRSSNTAHLTMGTHTFFLSLSFPDIRQAETYCEQMCTDVDAMEYRVDLLDCRNDRFELIYGMQLLRKYCRPHCTRVPALPSGKTVMEDVMPIVYTVRTQNQAGTWPDDTDGINRMFATLRSGLRGGVEVLDVESAWDKQKTDDLLALAKERYSSQILGSHHIVGRQIPTEEAVVLFEQCALSERAHGAKVVLTIDDGGKDRMAYEAALITKQLAATEGRPDIPNISLILGDAGQFSRIINFPFTPVTHEALPFKAAPGQLTSNEIMTTRILTKIFTPKNYGILGHNIAYSVSPQMHGAAFAATKLPHKYVRCDVETVTEFIDSKFFKSDDFGGLSVTIPHKQAIIPYVDVLSDAAKDICSVNTLVVKEEFDDDKGFTRIIFGDNTDWKGIYNPLRRLLSGKTDASNGFALILGAGGTARAAAYVAANKLGLKCLYSNRTPSKCDDLAESFGGEIVSNLGDSSDADKRSLGNMLNGGRVCVVISTLPAAAEMVLPNWLLNQKPVVFDVNYKPYNTKLLLQAEASGCQVIRGSEMLWEQGVAQFELWTERTAPYRIMKSIVLDNCIEKIE
jgi:pentafunctional AROM polypeptide